MYEINPSQIKAARALLGWSQGDLAEKASVSRTTIRTLEDAEVSIRPVTLAEIQKTLEKAGIEFLENGGIRRNTDNARIYKGPKSCEMFLDDMLQTIQEKGGDIFVYISSHGILHRLSVMAKPDNLEKLQSVHQSAKIKCLSPNTPSLDFSAPPFQFRKPDDISSPYCYYVYGDKRADISLDDDGNPMFVVYRGTAAMVAEYRKHFLSLWENALPHQIQVGSRKRYAANA